MSTTNGRAAAYLRISLDQTGEGLAIARQRELCEQIIAQRGWTLALPPFEDSISASDARKNRPGYDALVKAYEAGRFDALVCYDMDRLTRQPRQMEDWLDAAEKRGLALVTANGEADLTTDAGRTFVRVRMAFARGEVERKSARQKAAAVQRARLGRPPLGVRLTGYTVKGETVPDEAEIIRRIFKMFDAGESLRSIARLLTDEKVLTRHGKPSWNPSTIRDILTNPRYAGRAVYDGKPTGKRGIWEPLVSDDVFDLVHARLNDPQRKTNRVGTDRRHLGSGLYLCAECDEPVSGWSQGRYRCKDRHVNRARGPVDKCVREIIAAHLRHEDWADLLAPAKADLAPLLKEAKRLWKRLEATKADYRADRIDGYLFEEKAQGIKAEMKVVASQMAAHTTGAALRDILTADNPAQAFLDAGLMAQRTVIAALCTVRLHKGTRGSRTFDPNTVKVKPKRTQ